MLNPSSPSHSNWDQSWDLHRIVVKFLGEVVGMIGTEYTIIREFSKIFWTAFFCLYAFYSKMSMCPQMPPIFQNPSYATVGEILADLCCDAAVFCVWLYASICVSFICLLNSLVKNHTMPSVSNRWNQSCCVIECSNTSKKAREVHGYGAVNFRKGS